MLHFRNVPSENIGEVSRLAVYFKMAKSKRGRQPGPLVGRKPKRVKAEKRADVYEADDPEPEEERFAGQRYDVSKYNSWIQ